MEESGRGRPGEGMPVRGSRQGDPGAGHPPARPCSRGTRLCLPGTAPHTPPPPGQPRSAPPARGRLSPPVKRRGQSRRDPLSPPAVAVSRWCRGARAMRRALLALLVAAVAIVGAAPGPACPVTAPDEAGTRSRVGPAPRRAKVRPDQDTADRDGLGWAGTRMDKDGPGHTRPGWTGPGRDGPGQGWTRMDGDTPDRDRTGLIGMG